MSFATGMSSNRLFTGRGGLLAHAASVRAAAAKATTLSVEVMWESEQAVPHASILRAVRVVTRRTTQGLRDRIPKPLPVQRGLEAEEARIAAAPIAVRSFHA